MQGHGMFALPLNPAQLERLEDFFKIMQPSSLPQRQLLLPCIFRQITQYLKAGAKPICSSSRYGYIFQVLSFLERSISEKITSKDLAERFHVSKNKLEADFKRATGQTIHAFRMQIQLQSARMMLASSNKSQAEISIACGFTDESHLIRAFRDNFNITPGVFRKQCKQDPRWSK